MKIELNQYTKILAKSVVLENISITLFSGKIYYLTGKNGSGKSMLMRALCGLIRPTSGQLVVDGAPVNLNHALGFTTGALIENPAFINEYTGIQNLELLAGIRNVISKENIVNAMEEIGLEPFDKRIYKKYSLGMKQKLGIVAATMEYSDLILLDEPYNALDSAATNKLDALLLKLAQRGCIVVIASHTEDQILKLVDIKYVLVDGKLSESIYLKE